VLVVLGPLEAEMAGELVAEGAVLGSQAGVLGAGGAPPAPRMRATSCPRDLSRPPAVGGRLSALGTSRAAPAQCACEAAHIEQVSDRVKPESGMGFSSVSSWEESGRPHPARTALNLSQPS